MQILLGNSSAGIYEAPLFGVQLSILDLGNIKEAILKLLKI